MLVKNAISQGPMNRQAYMSFDLSEIDRTQIEEADLLLQFAPSGWGLASQLPDCTFNVYGLAGEVPDWDESDIGDQFPGNPKNVYLGSFVLAKGVQKGRFGVRTEDLTKFLQTRTHSQITFMVMRKPEKPKTVVSFMGLQAGGIPRCLRHSCDTLESSLRRKSPHRFAFPILCLKFFDGQSALGLEACRTACLL